MKAAIDAVIALLRASAAIAPYLGVSASTNQPGPFADVAEERTQCPYTVISHIPGTENRYQFTGAAYNEPIRIQLATFDVTKTGAAVKAEMIANVLDTSGALSLAHGEKCRRVLRKGPVRTLDAGINERSQRVYQGIQEYHLNVQRALGISNSIVSVVGGGANTALVTFAEAVIAAGVDGTKFAVNGVFADGSVGVNQHTSTSVFIEFDAWDTNLSGESWQAIAGFTVGVAPASGTIS